ncbi:MAG: bifunctional metallophosphatase/5'-nucleotidase [Bacteroidales bacterium]|nr:bifunctional metallophosphatase/5'-nucleotidase [Bacteroidales bacterium]
MIRKIILLVFVSALSYLAGFSQNNASKKLIILHTNDLHSRLNGYAPEMDYTPSTMNDDETIGGFARIATLIKQEKNKEGDNLLVLDAGDFLMGTLFPALEQSTGFQLDLMKTMGFDVVTLGNHEYDYGPAALSGIIEKSVENGPVPYLVASNLSFTDKDNKADGLKSLFTSNILKPYVIVERQGLKIGIFGILGYNAIEDAPNAKPVIFDDPVKSARLYAKLLKEKEKADLVICLSHSGVKKEADGSWTGEDVKLAEKVPEIDVIISGHTHSLIDSPLIVNGVPIVQTGAYGAGLGRLELEISGGKIINSSSKVIPINDAIEGDPDIQQLIVAQEKRISTEVLGSLNLNYSQAIAETSFPLICDEDTLLENSNLGMLLADADYYYVNHKSPQGVDISLYAAGMVRDNLIPGKTGEQNLADIFRVASLGSGKDNIPGYALARIYVTGKELKGILEILYMAPAGNKDNYIYFGGLRAGYNPEKGMLRKISSIEVGDSEKGFKKVDWSKNNKELYSITADTYLLQFIGIIKKLSHGLVKVTLKDEHGNPLKSFNEAIIDGNPNLEGTQELKEWIALVWYLQQQKDLNGNGIPDIPDTYRKGSPRLFSIQN